MSVASVGFTAPPAGAGMLTTKGIAVYVTTLGDSNATLMAANAVFSYCESLDANTVQLDVPFIQSGATTNDPGPAPVTPSPELLSRIITIAKQDGLAVQLRPLLYEGNLAPAWRGNIDPSEPSMWFSNYADFLAPYVAMAQSDAVSAIYLSAELDSMVKKFPGKWRALAASLQPAFSGRSSIRPRIRGISRSGSHR